MSRAKKVTLDQVLDELAQEVALYRRAMGVMGKNPKMELLLCLIRASDMLVTEMTKETPNA